MATRKRIAIAPGTAFDCTLFSTVSLGGVGGGQLSNLICQVLDVLVFSG